MPIGSTVQVSRKRSTCRSAGSLGFNETNMTTKEAYCNELYALAKNARSEDRDAAAAILMRAYLSHNPERSYEWYVLGDAHTR